MRGRHRDGGAASRDDASGPQAWHINTTETTLSPFTLFLTLNINILCNSLLFTFCCSTKSYSRLPQTVFSLGCSLFTLHITHHTQADVSPGIKKHSGINLPPTTLIQSSSYGFYGRDFDYAVPCTITSRCTLPSYKQPPTPQIFPMPKAQSSSPPNPPHQTPQPPQTRT